MRLERLEVAGFGCLRDVRVDFGPAVTVVVGDNEAGKSTLHRALRAALYGLDAGGPGRAVERSEWARWAPWAGTQYGLALTYSTASGRRYRVARRLEQRDRAAQVQEVGGRDVTDDMRVGREVAPGQLHLHIDEAVFCATACLSEDGLRPEGPDSTGERADRLQEAIERLADSASRATAAEALGRIRAAMDRVGTEGRSRSPLGAATGRLKTVELELQRAREATEVLSRERERLRELEAAAETAEAARLAAERAWLCGRLAAITVQRRALAEALAEAARLQELAAERGDVAAFPLDREERVTALGSELRLAAEAEAEARARWDEARARLREIERRRLDIAASVRVLGRVPHVDTRSREEAASLAAEVAAEGGVARRADDVRAADARAAALRREIASTGMGSVPVGGADAVAELVEEARRGGEARRMAPVAGAVAVVGLALGLGLLGAGVKAAAAVALAVTALAAGGLLLAQRLGGGPAASARRQLARMCPGLDLGEGGLDRAAQRLPDLHALHADLQRQEAVAAAGRADLEEATARLTDLAQRCLVLAARLPVEVVEPDLPTSDLAAPIGLLARARAALEAVGTAATAGRRRAEIEAEDAALAREEAACRALADEAERRAQARAVLGEEMERHLEAGGLPPEADPAAAVAAFRQGCAMRRQLEAARSGLLEVRRRIAALGTSDDDALARQEESLRDQLRSRGGDPEAVVDAEPLDTTALAALETDREHARQSAQAAGAEAAALRERLRGRLEALRPVADLEDERAACIAVRDRCLRQLEALRRAAALIEESAREVHRNVAPRLAASVTERLELLTEGRYDGANVDSDRFAVSLRCVDRPDLVPLELVSHGTRDQVGLLLRLALTEVLGEAGEPVPLLLDDPLVTADPWRREAALRFLVRLGATTQVVMTTADPAVADEVRRLAGDTCTVVTLATRQVREAAVPA